MKLRQKNDMIEPEEGNFAPIFEDMVCLTEEKVDCNKINYIILCMVCPIQFMDGFSQDVYNIV